jgi:hypothetical protein
VWLEVHPPVDAQGQRAAVDIESFYALANAALGETPAAIHWDFVLATLQQASGLPQMVGVEVNAEDVPVAPPALTAPDGTTPAAAAPDGAAPIEAPPQAEPPAAPQAPLPLPPADPAPASEPIPSDAPPAPAAPPAN